VDVGTDQLAETLRKDSRVVNKEQCNFRYATKEEIPGEIQFASVDVSFISLEKILPTLYSLLASNGRAVCLIKPQFEAGRENLSKNGVVRNANVHIRVIHQVMTVLSLLGFTPLGLTHSPIKGPMGNIEYLVYVTKEKLSSGKEILPDAIVRNAHKELGEKD
jgi:23S rRNA (cytidine1920-2'-O)/16S rRNA (cytidine1409-2'-O)-methyltransferase